MLLDVSICESKCCNRQSEAIEVDVECTRAGEALREVRDATRRSAWKA